VTATSVHNMIEYDSGERRINYEHQKNAAAPTWFLYRIPYVKAPRSRQWPLPLKSPE